LEQGMGMTWKHLFVLLSVLGATVLWLSQSPPEMEARFPMPAGRIYVEECGSCHTAYAPGLLPVRAWHKMMNDLSHHFGDDATLEEPRYFAILKELETLASDGSYADMRMRRISASIPPGEVPQRIIDTVYFKYLHDEVPAAFWKRKAVGSPANCIACHVGANEGRYGVREVRIPAD
jgi:hypothetical protein